MDCLLCATTDASIFWEQKKHISWVKYAKPHPVDKILRFFKCTNCELIFKSPDVFPRPVEEKSIYLQHENNPEEVGYRSFLMQLLEPVMARVEKETAKGLDFGSGPVPSNAKILNDLGYQCESYDPYFNNKLELLENKYDFITCSEVTEHFYKPAIEFQKLSSLLLPKGLVGVMTKEPPEDFVNWWYHRDPTHVVFYSKKTFLWIGNNFGFDVEFLPNHVTLLIKN